MVKIKRFKIFLEIRQKWASCEAKNTKFALLNSIN